MIATFPSAPSLPAGMTPDQLAAFHQDGFHVARGLIPMDEILAIRSHYDELHRRAPIYEVYTTDPSSSDPLKVYPRMMQPHRWDAFSKRYLLDERILGVLRCAIGEEPLAAQSMFYFKPPGAEGQHFHQDNFYLMATPGTCYAAWLAVDDADHENGGLMVQPGSHLRGLGTPARGDVTQWGNLTNPPTSEQTVEVSMRAGDCLFFSGSLIHGSLANRSEQRWRRSFICHYVGAATTKQVGAYYHPIFAADGSIAPIVGGLEFPPGNAT
jgi:phytanoyl-CoA hydroxylase